MAAASFMKHSYDRGLRGRSTLTSAIPSAISGLFRYSGSNPCASPLVREVRKTLSRLSAPPKQKAPLTQAHLTAMAANVSPTFKSVRDFFMILVMMVCMLRESEVVMLKPSDVWVQLVEGARCLFVLVETSKTDQCRNGHTIVVAEATHRPICPIHCFYALSRFRSPAMPFLFHREDLSPSPLSKATPNHILKSLLASIGVDPKPYGSHSARRGGVSAAIRNNIDLRLVARHGNWKSDAVFLYISDSLQSKLSVSRAILND